MAASKPGGRMLETGTGTGVGTCWLLDGMDATARLTTVDIDPTVQTIARAWKATQQQRKSKDQLWRDFQGYSIFDFCNNIGTKQTFDPPMNSGIDVMGQRQTARLVRYSVTDA
jgi:tRNA A58 N-methylase Trm61